MFRSFFLSYFIYFNIYSVFAINYILLYFLFLAKLHVSKITYSN